MRKVALQSIGASLVTLPHLLDRIRDLKPDVRVVAFEMLESKVDLQSLTIKQRNNVLHYGLRDRDEGTHTELICAITIITVTPYDTTESLSATTAALPAFCTCKIRYLSCNYSINLSS